MAPVQPKKPVGGAYGVFVAENRPRFQKATAGQKASAVSKLASEEWKTTTDAEKKTFQKKYEDKKAQFDKDMEAFLAAGGVKEKGARGKATEKRKEKDGKKKERDPNMPKKPGFGAFGLYVNENREAIKAKLPANSAGPAVNKQAKTQWEALADKDKAPWEAKFKKKQEEYKKAMEKYKADKAAAGDEDEDEEDEEDEDDEEEEEKKPAAKKTKKA